MMSIFFKFRDIIPEVLLSLYYRLFVRGFNTPMLASGLLIKTDDGRDLPIMTMGPICIAPELKRQGQSNTTVLKLEERNKQDEDSFASFCNVHKLFEEIEKLNE